MKVSSLSIRKVNKLLLFIAFTICATPFTATYASNGMNLIGFGAISRSMGGVGIALPGDAMAAASNPAGMSRVGTRYDIAAEYFRPIRGMYGRNLGNNNGAINQSFPNVDMDSSRNNFIMPTMGFNYVLNDKMTFGVSVVGGGLGTTYKQNIFDLNSFGEQHYQLYIFLIQMQFLPTFTYKINENHAIGISPVIALQSFSAKGLGEFGVFQMTKDANNLTDKRTEYVYGGGGKIGWLGDFMDKKLSIGAYWASKVYMADFNKYRGLFADENLSIPENYGIGIAIKPNKKLTVAFDVTKTLYEDIPAIANDHPANCWQGVPGCGFLAANLGGAKITGTGDYSDKMGLPNGMGFGWKNQTVYKLGVALKYNSKVTLRAGLNYGKSPIPDDQILFAVLAPAVTEKHLTLGFTYKYDKATDLTFNYMHAFKARQNCAGKTHTAFADYNAAAFANRGCETMLTGDGESEFDSHIAGDVGVHMKQDAVGFQLSRRFD